MTPKHVIIEAVYKQVALACECNWRHVNKMKHTRILLAYCLVQFLDREHVSEIMNIRGKSIATHYLREANSLLISDDKFKPLVKSVLSNARKALWLNNTNVLIASYDSQVKAVIVE